MSLTVWDPFHDMEKLLDKYSRTSRKSLAKSDDRALEVGDWMPIVDIDETADGIHAKYHHGTLNLRIPKAEEVKPKQIEVKVD